MKTDNRSEKYHYIDMHCDTLLYDVRNRTGNMYSIPEAMLDLGRMKKGKTFCQFFAVFFPQENDDDEQFFASARSSLITAVRQNRDIIAHAGCIEDIEENKRKGLMSAVLTIEDGRAVNGSIERLKRFHSEGVRAMALTWNFENCFGYPNSKDAAIMKRGLTDFGREAVAAMNEMGMLIDVSHLSDGGFYDVAEISEKPFAATHSDCRALCPNQRNLTDDMIRVLAQKGGVAGLNFAPMFLDRNEDESVSRISDMVDHVKHFIAVGGEDCVGIGTDFDGISGNLEVGSPVEMYRLFDALVKAGITPRQIDKIASGNVMRVIRDTMRGHMEKTL